MNIRIDHVAVESKSFRKMGRLSPGVVCVIAFLIFTNSASAQYVSQECGSLDNGFGPFDYTDPSHLVKQPGETISKREIVERVHFTREVENLISGFEVRDPLADLDYTLRAFPNHHRALSSMANYHILKKTQKLDGYSIDCWFERAITFRSDDALVRVVYAIYLIKTGKNEKALVQYQDAVKLQPDSADAQYGIGLMYTNMGNYDLAFEHADRAYELGYPLPGLRNRLIKAGAWKQKLDEE